MLLVFLVSTGAIVLGVSLMFAGLAGVWGVLGLFMVATMLSSFFAVMRSMREDNHVVAVQAAAQLRG